MFEICKVISEFFELILVIIVVPQNLSYGLTISPLDTEFRQIVVSMWGVIIEPISSCLNHPSLSVVIKYPTIVEYIGNVIADVSIGVGPNL